MTKAGNSQIMRTIPLLITIFSLSLPAYAQYSGGTGEPNDPYQIATAEDLMLLGETAEDYDKHFILIDDIDLNPNLPGRKVFDRAVIAPDVNDGNFDLFGIVFDGTPFTGVLDGNHHRISHLKITGESYLGLFGELGSGAVISNLGLEAVDVNGTGYYVGGLVGSNSGWFDQSTVLTNCYSTGVVSGGSYVGGLVGRNSSSITNSYSTSSVSGNSDIGGLAGSNLGTITMSYSAGTVTGNENIGGLVGRDWEEGFTMVFSGITTASFWDAESSGQSNSAGGTGLTTAEMQNIDTFLSAGWDFVDETLNGTCDYWRISPGDYPMLRYHADGAPVMPEGLGTPEQPYLIRDARDLGTVWFKPQAHYRLVTSLDLSGITWSMAVIPRFGGTFDGNDYVISNVVITGSSHLGLFGQLENGAVVKNLGAVDVNIIGSHDYVASLVGHNSGSITTCYSTTTVNGGNRDLVGGLVGSNGGTITTSYSTGTVSGSWRVGGLIGFNSRNGIITTSYSTGVVYGGYGTVGGLVGGNGGSVTYCNCSGTVGGGNYVANVGGLVGSNGGTITTSYSTGSVSGSYRVGGLVGSNAGSIATCRSTGLVSGGASIGGLVGDNGYGSITSCYSTGSVSATGWRACAGGLVGVNGSNASITESYSTGTVSGGLVGGLVGCYNNESIISSFWDKQASGLITGVVGIGKTTAEMQTASTFLEAGWDFVGETVNGPNDVWKISEGLDYPRLWWEKYGGGTGEPNDPYRIYTAEHLNELGAEPNDYDKHFNLMADIDLSGYVYDRAVIAPDANDVEVGFQGTPFTGVFNGNDYSISHLKIMGGSHLGLFGQTGWGAMISNLGLEAVDVNGPSDIAEAIGGLVGSNGGTLSSFMSRFSSIVGCYSTGMVSGHWNVGGLAGMNLGGIISSYSSGTVIGDLSVGGLVGVNLGSTITTSYSTGSVTGDGTVGGLVGCNAGGIHTSYSTGAVTGNVCGGLVGVNNEGFVPSGIITSSFWDVETSGQVYDEPWRGEGDGDRSVGLTTAEMQTASTFLDAGWDFVDEVDNGTDDIWWILEGQDYPRLSWEAHD